MRKNNTNTQVKNSKKFIQSPALNVSSWEQIRAAGDVLDKPKPIAIKTTRIDGVIVRTPIYAD